MQNRGHAITITDRFHAVSSAPMHANAVGNSFVAILVLDVPASLCDAERKATE
jgi:hypothetical protein